LQRDLNAVRIFPHPTDTIPHRTAHS